MNIPGNPENETWILQYGGWRGRARTKWRRMESSRGEKPMTTIDLSLARARARARAPNTDRIPRARASRLDNSTEIANCRHITREIQICLSRRDTKRTRDATARLAPQYREPKTLAISHGPARHASSPANSPQIEDVCRKLSARDGIRSLT